MKDAGNTHEINKKSYEDKSKGFLFLFVSENNSHLHLSKRMENSSFKISVIFPSFHVSPTHKDADCTKNIFMYSQYVLWVRFTLLKGRGGGGFRGRRGR